MRKSLRLRSVTKLPSASLTVRKTLTRSTSILSVSWASDGVLRNHRAQANGAETTRKKSRILNCEPWALPPDSFNSPSELPDIDGKYRNSWEKSLRLLQEPGSLHRSGPNSYRDSPVLYRSPDRGQIRI